VLHVEIGKQLEIGAFSTIAHGCVVHGRTVGAGSLIGNGATLLDGSTVGSGCLIGAGSLVTRGTYIPDGMLALGAPARVVGPADANPDVKRILETNADTYLRLMRRHRDGSRSCLISDVAQVPRTGSSPMKLSWGSNRCLDCGVSQRARHTLAVLVPGYGWLSVSWCAECARDRLMGPESPDDDREYIQHVWLTFKG
jgi:hypothetical protein